MSNTGDKRNTLRERYVSATEQLLKQHRSPDMFLHWASLIFQKFCLSRTHTHMLPHTLRLGICIGRNQNFRTFLVKEGCLHPCGKCHFKCQVADGKLLWRAAVDMATQLDRFSMKLTGVGWISSWICTSICSTFLKSTISHWNESSAEVRER